MLHITKFIGLDQGLLSQHMKKAWLNWLGEFGKELRIHMKDRKKQHEWLKEFISKMVVKPV
jgi:hypothetical protein